MSSDEVKGAQTQNQAIQNTTTAGPLPWQGNNYLAGASSWQMGRAIQADVAGDLMRPTVPSADSLSALRELSFFLKEDGSNVPPELKSVFEYEAQYLRAGLKALENPTLRAKFGGGLQAAANIGALIKEQHAQMTLERHLRGYAPPITELEETTSDD